MLPKPPATATGDGGATKPNYTTTSGDAGLLHDIETLSKALSLDTKKKPPPSRSISAPKSHHPPIQNPNPKKSNSKPVKKQSFWSNFNPIKALSAQFRSHRRFTCRFSLHVHSITALTPPLSASALVVSWRRTTDPLSAALSTRPARASAGAAHFNEVLTCSVYVARSSGPKGSAKYEPRHFLIYVKDVDRQDLDLGKNLIDLTRLLPVSLEELDGEERGSGKWTTSFRLAGKAKGAVLNVSFGFEVVGSSDEVEVEKRVVARGGSTMAGQRVQSRSRELHEVLPCSRSEASVLDNVGAKLASPKLGDSKEEDLKPGKGDGAEKECEEAVFTVIEQGDRIWEPELQKKIEFRGKDGADITVKELVGEPELENIEFEAEKGAEVTAKDQLCESIDEEIGIGHGHEEASVEKVDLQLEEVMLDSRYVSEDQEIEEVLDFAFDSPSIVEWQKKMESRYVLDFATDSKSQAKMMEDAETEALMREWGLNEKAFHRSPPGSRSGFGSPIDIPPEEPLELPPLCEGLGPFVQTKDGGFLRSMSPALFNNAKNNGNLIMQVSNPVVVPAEIGNGIFLLFGTRQPSHPTLYPRVAGLELVSRGEHCAQQPRTPAEMGHGIMDIMQRLASVGIEKLSMQAKKLMPLEDVTGKTMQQLAWEAAPALESCERQDLSQHMKAEVVEPVVNQIAIRRSKISKSSKTASSGGGETSSEYVSLEDLAPLVMDKIEALSIEGLRIQSGMSDEGAPSNISPQSFGDISALEGKGTMNSMSLGLEGTGGLQLLDVEDSGDDVDGLMGLSITLDEWMRLDSGVVDEDVISDQTSKILAAHHARSAEMVCGYNETEPEKKTELVVQQEKKEEEVVVPQFKITEVHVAGTNTEPGKKKPWGNPVQQQSSSRWLRATGMGKSNKHPFMKSKAVSKPSPATTTVQPGDTLRSISSWVHGAFLRGFMAMERSGKSY